MSKDVKRDFTGISPMSDEFSDGTVDEDAVYPEIKDAVGDGLVDPDLIYTWHIVPSGDGREHDLTPRVCWCGPEVEEHEGGFIITHNSTDGREDYEQGRRKLN